MSFAGRLICRPWFVSFKRTSWKLRELTMPSELHETLCRKAKSWLKKNGFGVVGVNVWATGSRERADCVGFRANCSVLIEAKVSRADYSSDLKKPERQSGGVGTYRFYVTPPGLIAINELPAGWGLLELQGKSLVMVHGPQGNYWPSYDDAVSDKYSWWAEFAHKRDEAADRAMLYSVARKLK